MRLAVYFDVFTKTEIPESVLDGAHIKEDDFLLLYPSNLVKNKKKINSTQVFLFANLYINSSGMKFAEFLVGEGKTVLALPGSPERYSTKGLNFLIQTGNALMITCAQDLIGLLNQ